MIRFALTTIPVVMIGVRPLAAQTVVAGATAAQIATDVGDRITVPVKVDMTNAGGLLLGSYEARLTWDPTVLGFVSSSSGSFASAVFNTDSSAFGVVRLAGANAAGASGITTLGEVRLEVLTTASSSAISVSFDDLTAAGTFGDLLPFLSTTTLTFCPGYWIGDLDDNSAIQALDAQIVAMHAVGLAVSDTSAGDADGDGVVDTRDALIILSYVVGLDVTAFPIGQFGSGACSQSLPGSVTIDADTLALATGDVVTAQAEVKDTAGNVIGGLNLAWSSTNTGVATVDTLGNVTGVAQGSATLVAAAAPGITDTAVIAVGPRHRWRVDPATAQNNDSEVGSDAYPFSTIAQAIAAAVDDDTISIALGHYNEPITTTKRLVFEGDSTAQGMPVISTPDEPAGVISVTGKQIITRLEFHESRKGLEIRADTVGLASLGFRSVRGPAVEVHSAGAVGLLDVTVNGALGGGILIDTAGTGAAVVGIGRTQVFGVGERLDTLLGDGFPVGIAVRGDTVVVDSVVVRGVAGNGILAADAYWFAVGASEVSQVEGVGIGADSTVVLFDVFDSTRVTGAAMAGIAATDVDTVRMTDSRADSSGMAGLWVYRADLVEVDGSAFEGSISGVVVDSLVNVAVVRNSVVRGGAGTGIWLVADSMLVENATVASTGGPAIGSVPFFPGDTGGTQRLTVRGGRVSNTGSDGMFVSGIARLTIVGVEIDSTARCCSGSPWWAGAYLGTIDTVRVDSNTVHDNYASAVWLTGATVFTARDNMFERNYFMSDDGDGLTDRATIYLQDVNSADVRSNSLTGNHGAGVSVQYWADSGVAVVDSNSFRGKYWGVRSGAWDTTTSHIEVTNNSFVGDLAGPWTRQIGMGPLRTIIVENNTIDSTFGTGIGVWPGDTITVKNNVITNIAGSDGIYSERGAAALFDGNSITCVDSNTTYGIEYNTGGGSVTNNTVSRCYYGGSSYNWQYWYNSFALTVRGNAFTAGSSVMPPIAGYLVQGVSYASAQLVGNTVSGGAYSLGGIAVNGSSGYRNNYVRVDSNTVQAGAGLGVSVMWADSVSVNGNTVSGIDTLSVSGASGIRSSNVFWWARITRNTVTGNGVPGIRVDGTASGVAIDTNLIADNLGAGLLLHSAATGRFNSVRRNGTGILDSVGTGSVFRSNNIEGNAFGVRNLGFAALDADSSWWGDPLGPACAIGCDTASTGDSISTNVIVTTVAADTILAAPLGAPPAIAVDIAPITRHAEIDTGLQAEPREREVTAGGGVARAGAGPMAAPSQRPVKRPMRPRRKEQRR